VIDVPRKDIVTMLEAGYIYLAMKRFQDAKKLFEGVCELAPKHDVPLVALSNVYFTQNKYLEAIRILKKAIKDNPDSAYAYVHLAESQLFYGKRDDAFKSMEKAMELEPEGKSGDFAKSLKELADKGYDPVQLRKDTKKNIAEKVKNLKEEEKKK
jgi:tetratricopeptide (TPR) repeat protein